MKKYLMSAVAMLAVSAGFVACSNDEDFYDPELAVQNEIASLEANYQVVFEKAFGTPSQNHTWGFGEYSATRSAQAPVVGNIDAPFDEAWVATYNETAKEPNSTNVADNYDNSSYATNYGEGGPNSIDWDDPDQVKDRNYFFGDDGNQDSWETRLAWALANHPTWVTYTPDETFVRNFKITGTWNGGISVAATEGLTDGVANGNERTIVVTGTWNITENQTIGSLGKIIVANGGTVNVASGVTLNMTNQGRLVVLRGGKLTGAGSVSVNNGNAAGEENYNEGTIDVATFNNNFGKFYNYGKFLVTEYQGGAQESNFYNHALAAIDRFGGSGSTANARIFNGCQFYVKGDARIRNYEGVNGSALIVGGQLLCSGSEDGTSTPSYVGLEAGALVQAGSLYNNGTSWSGPTSGGYAVINIGKFDFMNWEQDAPQNGGYFANNIYLVADDLSNVPEGNGYQAGETATAEYKFKNIVANATGNGNVEIVEKGDDEVIPADGDFQLGQSGCTPGFKIRKIESTEKKVRIICEDMTVAELDAQGNVLAKGDFDFNDAVFDLYLDDNDNVTAIELLYAGAEFGITVDGVEIHEALGIGKKNNSNYLYQMGAGSGSYKFTPSSNTYKPIDVPVIVTRTFETKESVILYNVTLGSVRGKAPGKILVKPTFQIVPERTSIDVRYPKFSEWVADENVEWY